LRPDGVERLEQSLEGLLALLECEDEGVAGAIEGSFEEVRQAFEAVRPAMSAGGDEARWTRCLRLYAIVLNTLTRQREHLVRTERSCQLAAERLGALRKGHTSGINCNVRG
jgi:hypothetical protein